MNFLCLKKTDTQTYAIINGTNQYIVKVKPNGRSSSSFSLEDTNVINRTYQLK